MSNVRVIQGDNREVLRGLPANSVHMCVTSPPYWGLRRYPIPDVVWGGDHGCGHEWGEELPDSHTSGLAVGGHTGSDKQGGGRDTARGKTSGAFCIKCSDPTHVHEWSEEGRSGQRIRNGAEGGLHDGRATNKMADNVVLNPSAGASCGCGAWKGQLGNEPTPALYVQHLVEVFREVRRVLRPDGTLWLNLGDSYYQGPKGNSGDLRPGTKQATNVGSLDTLRGDFLGSNRSHKRDGLKPKDLVGIPWMTAFALRDDGWWFRAPIIWEKPSCMPDSTDDRVTISHEYLFMMTKSATYFYDNEAIKEPAAEASAARYQYGFGGPKNEALAADDSPTTLVGSRISTETRNKRSVWRINTVSYREAHFATWPPKLVEPCILAGTSAKGACPTCGAPWRRVLERIKHQDRDVTVEQDFFGSVTTTPHEALDPEAERIASERTGRMDGHVAGPEGKVDEVRTVGWEPTCQEYVGKNTTTDPQDRARRILLNVKAARDAGGAHDNPFPQKQTVGWAKGCGCDVEPVPCVVLDPFGGSGTTGMVAQQHGRDAILIELAESYIPMIEERTRPQSFEFGA